LLELCQHNQSFEGDISKIIGIVKDIFWIGEVLKVLCSGSGICIQMPVVPFMLILELLELGAILLDVFLGEARLGVILVATQGGG